ncbi:class I SAM-dependent methyltransferase [Streptomyces sp. Wh19]|uniref:class I SAM-dependent methyltransferase n=1 Tax=Streptomyces sp. Wh19 TaxID=3076629 RepID=UPI0029586C3F|nr:class I SAM-dependent methyltransferase [Streptomyces sp. Wh19]MDV9194451.1 class I SAM-dependent methyltransferase [Streptomyces sp. Wh19]
MGNHVSDHYDHLATHYDAIWNHRPAYVDWMSERMSELLTLRPGERIADLGSGTGLFLRRLLPNGSAQTPVLAVDPSAAMLTRLPDDPRLLSVHATAEQFAANSVATPYDELDAITVKESVHHFSDLGQTLTGLAGRLAEGGRLLIVTLPPKTGYPLFPAAYDRFAEWQPEPQEMAEMLRGAGLTVQVSYAQYEVTIATDEWISLVSQRWMSVLSSFSDADLERGVAEMKEMFTDAELRFSDRFAFILGIREPSAQ